jgi:hypothetical protein
MPVPKAIGPKEGAGVGRGTGVCVAEGGAIGVAVSILGCTVGAAVKVTSAIMDVGMGGLSCDPEVMEMARAIAVMTMATSTTRSGISFLVIIFPPSPKKRSSSAPALYLADGKVVVIVLRRYLPHMAKDGGYVSI